MAVTFAPAGTFPANALVPGSRRRWFGTVTFDTSYPTGGYTLTPSSFGLVTIDSVQVSGSSSAGKPVTWVGSKLKVFASIGTEVTNATDLHTESVVVEVVGE